MNYDNFTANQKVLMHSIANKIENSGCDSGEVFDVLSEVFGSLLAYVASSRGLLALYMDTKILQDLRRKAIAYFDLKQVNEEYKNI
jgi:hypothetical protein